MNASTETAAQKKTREAAEKKAADHAAKEKAAEAKALADQKAAEAKAAAEKKAADKAEADRVKAEKKAAADKEKADKKAAADKAKADKKAETEAKRAAKLKEEQDKKDALAAHKAANTRNGITRPRADGKCGIAWALFDEISAAKGAPAAMAEIKAHPTYTNHNPANVSAEYARWKKYFGLPPGKIPAATPPAPVAQ